MTMTDSQLIELDQTIAGLTKQWLEIANGRSSFGAGTAAEQATVFQMQRLLPLSAKRCRARLGPTLAPTVDALVSLVGMSPQTTIMVSEALQPRQLLLVTSENARASIDAIEAWFASPERDWNPPSVTIKIVPPTDSEITAQAVREWIASLRAKAPSTRIVFDATGGKKSMSVIAGMLAVQLGLEVVYLDSTFDPSLRMPRPGSEVVVPIAVPTATAR
jgi:hypothetical protein